MDERGREDAERMNGLRLKEQVELIRQVFGYVNQFHGKIFVIHIDSRVMLQPLFSVLVRDLVLLHKLGIRMILVPGSQVRIDEILDQYEVPWRSVKGVRISSERAMPFIKMAAFDVSNMLMTLLAENRTDAVIGNWVRARSMGVIEGVDYQCTGRVDKLKIEIIESVLEQGLIPIFPNIGWNARGRPYNISSVELAAVLSRELVAEKLFFLTWADYISADRFVVPEGVEVDSSGTLSRLTVEEARAFLQLNAGLVEQEAEQQEAERRSDSEAEQPALLAHPLSLLELAVGSCESGVKRVHIVDGSVEGVILKEIFSSRGFGTMIYADEYAHIRPMSQADIPEVLRIMQPLVEKEILVARTDRSLAEQCDRFIVYEVDGIIHAGGALHRFPDGLGEIAGVAVDETYSSMGMGKKVVSYLLDRARNEGLRRVFVLTTQTQDWFLQMGFQRGEADMLPAEKRRGYNSKRNSLVLYYDLEAT